MAEIDDENIVNEDNQYSRVDTTTTEPIGANFPEIKVTPESSLSPYMKTYLDKVQSGAKKAMLNADFGFLGGYFEKEYLIALKAVDKNIQNLRVSDQTKTNIYKDQSKIDQYVKVYNNWRDSGGTGEFVLFNPDLDPETEFSVGKLATKLRNRENKLTQEQMRKQNEVVARSNKVTSFNLKIKGKPQPLPNEIVTTFDENTGGYITEYQPIEYKTLEQEILTKVIPSYIAQTKFYEELQKTGDARSIISFNRIMEDKKNPALGFFENVVPKEILETSLKQIQNDYTADGYIAYTKANNLPDKLDVNTLNDHFKGTPIYFDMDNGELRANYGDQSAKELQAAPGGIFQGAVELFTGKESLGMNSLVFDPSNPEELSQWIQTTLLTVEEEKSINTGDFEKNRNNYYKLQLSHPEKFQSSQINTKAIEKYVVKQKEQVVSLAKRLESDKNELDKLKGTETIIKYDNLVKEYTTLNDRLTEIKKNLEGKTNPSEKDINDYNLQVENLNKIYQSIEEVKKTDEFFIYSELDKSIVGNSIDLVNLSENAKTIEEQNKVAIARQYLEKEAEGSFVGNIASGLLTGMMERAESSVILGLDAAVGSGLIKVDDLFGPSYTVDLDKSETQKYNEFKRELSNVFDNEITNRFTEAVYGTTEEYAQSDKRSDFEKSARMVSESIGTIIGGAGNKYLTLFGFFSQAYNATNKEMRGEEFDDLTSFEKNILAVPLSIGVGYLDKLGAKVSLGDPLIKNLLFKTLSKSITEIPKDATLEYVESVVKTNIVKQIAKSGLTIVAGSFVEGFTEGSQEVLSMSAKALFNEYHKKDLFNLPDITTEKGREEAKNIVLENAYYGAIGGVIMSSGEQAVSALKNGFDNSKADAKFDLLYNTITNPELILTAKNAIKLDLANKKITRETADQQMESVNSVYSLFQSIPKELSTEQKKEAFNLIREKQTIEKEIEGKDPSLVDAQKKRVSEINESLKAISNNATKETTNQQQAVTTEGGVSEYQGTSEGQQKVGQGEGGQRETTVNETDSGNSTIPSQVQEEVTTEATIEERRLEELKSKEVDKFFSEVPGETVAQVKERERKQKVQDQINAKYDAELSALNKGKVSTTDMGTNSPQIEQLRAEEQAELLKVIPKIENYKVNGEIDKTLMPKTVLDKYNKVYNKYDKLISPLLETTGEITINKPAIATNTTAEVDRVKSLKEVDEDGATFNIDGVKYEGPGLVVPVISMNTTMKELSPKMISNFVEEHSDKIGDSETVKVGIYKFPNSNQVSIDLNILAPESSRGQAIEFGRLSGQESLFDMSTFENVKTGATGENPMQFTPKQFKEIAKALKEGRMPNVFGTQASTAKKTDYKQNLVTPENAREVASKQDTPLKQKIVKSANMVMRALPGVKVYLHNNQSEMHQAIADTTGRDIDDISNEVGNSAGAQIKREIHINMDTAKETTILHEAFHEAILRSGKSFQTITDFANGLKNIISDKAIKAKLDEFISMYKESDRAEEFLSELGAIMSEAETELTTTKFQKFLNLINRIARSLGLPVIIKSSATAQEAVDFINYMSKSLRTGEAIEEILEPASQILGTPIIKQSKQALIKDFDTTPPKVDGVEMIYPEKSTMDKILEDSGGAAVFINSDGTKVGKVFVNGREIIVNGGIDYTYIKKNVDDGIGFAASEDGKISVLKTISEQIIKERDQKNPSSVGKPIAVFVVSQNGETMLGEWYAAEYIMEGIDQSLIKRNYNGGITQAKKDFVNAIESAKIGKTKSGIADRKAKDKVIKMIKEGKFDTHNGRIQIAKDMASKAFSFGFRVNLNKELIASSEKSWNSGKNRNIKKALADSGYTMNDFWNKFLDERFLKDLNSQRLQADKGSSISNKTFSGFFYNPSDSLQDQVNHAKLGIKHEQFNSSFKSAGNFLLDSAYDVNKLFPNMGYPTQEGINEYNSSNNTNFNKKEMSIVDKIKVSTWLNENNKSKLVINPYGSIAMSMYTGYVDKSEQPSKIKLQKTAPNGKPSKLDDVQWEQVRTPAFKKWFGDWENDPKNASKIVDSNGEPMPVYHGTTEDFEIFMGGSYFTDDYMNADGYASGEIVLETFLNIKNPLIIDAKGKKWDNLEHKYGSSTQEITSYVSFISGENRYDGVVFNNINDNWFDDEEGDPQNVYYTLKSNQVKLADGSNTTFDATQPSIKLQKTTQETRMDNESENVFKKSMDRGTTWAKATQNALDYIQKSKWYQDATDVQREQKVRDFKQSKNQKLKKAPSVAKIMGTPKPKMVTVNEAAAFKDQLRLEAKAAREAKADLNSKRKSLSDAIKGMVKLGKLKVSQASTIIKRIGYVTLDSTVQVDRLIDYAAKVFERADYQEKLDRAFSYKRAIRKLLKTNNQAQVVGMANEFTKLDPSMVQNIEEYIDIAEKVKNAVAPSKSKTSTINDNIYFEMVLKQAANIEAVSKFVKDELEKQEQQLKDELLATNDDLLESGFISSDMTAKQIQGVIDSIKKDPAYKMDSKEKEGYMMTYLSQRFESLARTVSDIIKTNQNPVTGEMVAIDQKDVAIISDLLKVDLSEMGLRDAVFIVEAMDNFITNGITSKLEGALSTYKGEMGLKEEIKSGKVARPLKLYFTKKAGSVLAIEFTPLPLMIERMFTGVKSGISIMKSMGLSIVINGVNKANYLHNKIIDEYYNKFIRKSKTFHTPENVYERGMLSFLKRNVTGSLEEMKSETNRRVKMIEQSITTLKNKGDKSQKAMAEIYQKVFDKLDVSTGDIDVIESRVSKENKDAVNWWIKEWSKHYKDLSDISLSVYNYDLGSDLNYTPDKYKLIKTEEFDQKLIERNSSFLISMDNYTDKEKTGVMMQSTRPNAMEEGRYVSLDFDANNSNSLKGALVDINTAAGIRQVDGFLSSKLLDKLIPSTEDRDALVMRVNRYIRRSKGKIFMPKDLSKDVDAVINFAASLGVGKALGGVLQSVKQTIPIAISTAIMTGKFNIPSVSFNEWLNNTGMPTANRGLESLSTIESMDRRLEAKGTRIKDSVKAVQQLQQMYMKWFLSKPDVMIARTAFQSYYLQYMKESSIDWANHTPNQDALNYAEAMVGRQQNINDPMLGGEFLTAEQNEKRIAKKILFPFASFGLNQKARLNSDLINLSSKTTSTEDRKIALKSATATLAEMVAYRAIAVGIGYGFYKAAEAIIKNYVGDDEDDDDDKERDKKWFLSSAKFPLKSMINDLISPIPITDEFVTMGADYILSQYTGYTEAELDELVKKENEIRGLKDQDPLEGSQLKKFREEEKQKSLFQLAGKYESSKFGMGSIAYDAALKFYDEYQLGMTGEFKDEYKGNITTKKIRPVEQELIKNTLIFSSLFMLGILPKEADQMTTKVVNMIKKNAMSESEYEKYEGFKKEYKREPGHLEMALIKSDKKQDYIETELNFIKDEGGLNLVQAKEYVKVFNITNEVTPDDLSKIKEGQTADQIIKSLKKEYKERISEVQTETEGDGREVFQPIETKEKAEGVFQPIETKEKAEGVFQPIETEEENSEVFQPIK